MARVLHALVVLITFFASGTLGQLYLYHLRAQEPFQDDPTCTEPATVKFVLYSPQANLSSACRVSWANGLPPPSKPVNGSCQNRNMRFAFPAGTWRGAGNFTMALWASYKDPSLGNPPYDVNTLYSELNMTEGDRYICFQAGDCWARGPIKANILHEWSKK